MKVKEKLILLLLTIIIMIANYSFSSSIADNYGELPLVSWIEYWFDPDASTSLRMMIEKYKNNIVGSDELVGLIEEANDHYNLASGLTLFVDETVLSDDYVGIGIRCIAEDGHRVLPYDAIDPRHIYYPSLSDLSDGSYYFVQISSRIESNESTLFCFDQGDYGIDDSLTTYYWQDIYETDHCWTAAGKPWSNNPIEVPFPQEFSVIVSVQVYELLDLRPYLIESYNISIFTRKR